MSTEDKEKIIGRLVLEHQAAKEEAHLAGERLRSLGHSLLAISQQLKDGQFDTAHANLRLFRNEIVNVSTVIELIEEYRKAAEHASDLASKLSGMGIVLPRLP